MQTLAILLVVAIAVLSVIGLFIGVWSPAQYGGGFDDHSESDEDLLARERAAHDDD